MSAPESHKLIQAAETRLQSAESKLDRISPAIDKARRALEQAAEKWAMATMDLQEDALTRIRPTLNDGVHEAELARKDFDTVRQDKHAAEVHFKALEKLAARLDKLDKRYEDTLREVDDTLKKASVTRGRFSYSRERVERLQATLADIVADFDQELRSLEKAAPKLKEQAVQAAAQRDSKGLERAAQQFERLDIDKRRADVRSIQLKMNDLEATTRNMTNLPGERERVRLGQSVRELTPRLDKLATIGAEIADVSVRKVDIRAAARVLGLTDLKEIKELQQALGQGDMPRQLDPLARRHDASGKEWVRMLEKAGEL